MTTPKLTTAVNKRSQRLADKCARARDLAYNKKKYSQAVALYNEVLAEQRQTYGAVSKEVVQTLTAQCYLLFAWGIRSGKKHRHSRLEIAQEAYQDLISIVEAVEPNPMELSQVYQSASYAYAHDGKFIEGCVLMQQAIDLVGSISAVTNPRRQQLPHLLGHQGGFYIEAGDYETAVEVLQNALIVLEQNTGTKVHEDSYYLYQWLGHASKKLGNRIETARQDSHAARKRAKTAVKRK